MYNYAFKLHGTASNPCQNIEPKSLNTYTVNIGNLF